MYSLVCGWKLRHIGIRGVLMKGVLPLLVRWARRASTRDFFPCLAALVGSVQNTFSSSYITSLHLSPSLSKQAWQAVVPGLAMSPVSGCTLRQRDRQPTTTSTACPGCWTHWAMGTKNLKKSVRWGKQYFVLGWLVQPRQDKILFYWGAQQTNQGWTPFIFTPRVPLCLSFNSQQGPPLSSPLWL